MIDPQVIAQQLRAELDEMGPEAIEDAIRLQVDIVTDYVAAAKDRFPDAFPMPRVRHLKRHHVVRWVKENRPHLHALYTRLNADGSADRWIDLNLDVLYKKAGG